MRAQGPTERLVLHPLDEGEALSRDVVARSRRVGLDPPPRPDHGEHLMNPHLPAPQRLKDAAVLFAIGATSDGVPAVIFTERAGHLSAHAGQVALPGGKVEPGESAVAAALREAEEEVALHAAAVEPLAVTEVYVTRTGFRVAPVVGAIRRPVALVPDPGEVSGAFTVPLGYLFDLANHREIAFTQGAEQRRTTELLYAQRRIWGVTAGILRLLHERLYEAA